MVSGIEQWAELIRDIGVIIGIPTLIVIGMKIYRARIEVLTERIEVLRETSYDRALNVIRSQ